MGTWLPVREYSNESAAQRTAARPKAITLGKLRHRSERVFNVELRGLEPLTPTLHG